MVAESALMRCESRGTHYRSDCSAVNDPEWLRQILIAQEGDKMRLNTRPIKLPPELQELLAAVNANADGELSDEDFEIQLKSMQDSLEAQSEILLEEIAAAAAAGDKAAIATLEAEAATETTTDTEDDA